MKSASPGPGLTISSGCCWAATSGSVVALSDGASHPPLHMCLHASQPGWPYEHDCLLRYLKRIIHPCSWRHSTFCSGERLGSSFLLQAKRSEWLEMCQTLINHGIPPHCFAFLFKASRAVFKKCCLSLKATHVAALFPLHHPLHHLPCIC